MFIGAGATVRPDKLFGRGFFYGWVVVVAAFILMGVGFAVAYSFPRYFDPLSREFGADRAAISLVFSITGLIYFGAGAVFGPLTDRFGPRLLAVLAAVFYVIGLVLASRATEIWQIYLTYSVFVGLGVAATYVPSVSTVQRWFVGRRALASGLAVSGIGVGTFLGPIAANWVIQNYDWRAAYLATGAVAAVLTLIGGWLLLRSPAVLGLSADGAPLQAGAQPVRGRLNPLDRTVGEALKTREFIALYVVISFTCLPVFFAFTHLAPFAMDAGLDAATASQVGVGGIGVGSALGRLLLSPFADRLGRKLTYALTVAAIAALMAGWLVLPGDQVWALAVFAFLFGTAYGGFVALCPAMMADYFGTSYVSGTIGVFYTGAGLGAFFGPLLGGAIFDRTGSYVIAIAGSGILAVIAAVIVLRLRDPAKVKARWAAELAGQPPEPTLAGVATGAAVPLAIATPRSARPEPTPPAPAASTDPGDWPEWLAARRTDEARLAAHLAAWAAATTDAELAEVLEIAAARARDRGFLVRRAGPAPAAGAPAADELLPGEDDQVRLDRAIHELDRLAAPVGAPDEAAAALVERLRAGAAETRDLLREQRDRFRSPARRAAVRPLESAAAEVVSGGQADWKLLAGAGPATPAVVRVVQRPRSIVTMPRGGGLIIPIEGAGAVRVRGDAGGLALDDQAIGIGPDVEVEIAATGDGPLSYLIVSPAGPLPVGPAASPAGAIPAAPVGAFGPAHRLSRPPAQAVGFKK